MIRGRLRRRKGDDGGEEFFEIDPRELSGVFAAPNWLRDAGFSSWLLVGVALLTAAIVSLLALTQSIVIPVVLAGVIAAVAGPLVSWLKRHGVPRGLGAALVLLGLLGVGVFSAYLILTGIVSETAGIGDELRGAVDEVEGWLKDAGVSDGKAADAGKDVSEGVSAGYSGLVHGVLGGVEKLSSLAFFCAMTILSLFFLLKDGPSIRAWGEGRMGVPRPVARTVTSRVLQSLRGYFLGVTIVATFSAVLVGIGAWILGIPLAGTIAVITFLAGYIPYLGAWSAGAFSVLIALGGSGPEAAAGMVVIQLLANGPLQQIVQPVAYGAALGIHPLAVLIVTIAGGALFGAVGLILAAPVTAAIVRISVDLRGQPADAGPEQGAQPSPAPG
jgi:putative heme transporter